MGTYKLIQDIEAEDHILGPLTLRQFIFAIIAIFCFYISFIVVVKGVAFLLVLFLPPGLFFGFFALPFGRDQPTEVWALAKLRFWFKPRRRIWDQSGVKELVTITVPKKIEHVYTDGLSQTEVKSRLSALADTIDSRGWAVKNVNVASYMNNPMLQYSSDRLLDISTMPVAVPDEVTTASDDMLDERNNPIAQQFDAMMNQADQQHHQDLLSQMNGPVAATAPSTPWFMASGQAGGVQASGQSPYVSAADEAELEAALREAKQHQFPTPASNLRTLQPLSDPPAAAQTPQAAAVQPDSATDPTAVTAPADPAILSLANNNDLNVATLAREAQKTKGDGSGHGEVVISLR